jgi:hypothetical protein
MRKILEEIWKLNLDEILGMRQERYRSGLMK